MNLLDPRVYQRVLRFPASVIGMLPVLLAIVATAALLWGADVAVWGTKPTSGAREAVAWAGAGVLAMIIMIPLSDALTRLLRAGDTKDLPNLLKPTVTAARARQKRARDAAVDRAGRDKNWDRANLFEPLAAGITSVIARRSGMSPEAASFTPDFVRGRVATLLKDGHKKDHTLRDVVAGTADELWKEWNNQAGSAAQIDDLEAEHSRLLMSLCAPSLALRYPWSRSIQATRLGNAESAVSDRLSTRYGLDVGTTVPRLVMLLPEDERRLLSTAAQRVQVSVRLAVGWVLGAAWILTAFALVVESMDTPNPSTATNIARVIAALTAFVPAILLFMLPERSQFNIFRVVIMIYAPILLVVLTINAWPAVVLAPPAAFACLFLAAGAYRASIEHTIRWGQTIESAIDLHRLELIDALGWRRPRDADEERAIFAAMSTSYTIGAPAAGYRVWDDAIPAPSASGSALIDSIARLPDQLTDSVRAGVRLGLREDLAPVVERTLHNSLRGPILDNYDGHLSIALLTNGQTVPINDDGVTRVRWGDRYDLSVVIGPNPLNDGLNAPLQLRGGKDAPLVTFEVTIESNIPTLRQTARTIDVRPGQPADLSYTVSPADPGSETPWMWIQVAQAGHTMQSLELTLKGPGSGR
ncbi:hypothetical protein [Actinoplanes sp. HUAS TT8]|uniref:hypothetical protein n=1 Tax=Actinoplanes sp. HUAS TT8 TaxID=3447453 RepID=UPI003F527B1F